jgi:FkbM family methyltransferase
MKSFFFNLYSYIIKFFLCLNKPSVMGCSLLEKIDLVYDFRIEDMIIKVSCPNRLNLDRAESYLTKEPDMIQWINKFDEKVIFLDVGANVGLYSIYAAKRGVKKVISIEPESQNFALFNKNVYLNKLSSKIVGLNIGFSDRNGLESLFIPKFHPGSALNNLGDNLNYKKEFFLEDFKQSVISFTIDSFFMSYPDFFPTHLKIDVDGIERKIINGAIKTLSDPRLREIVIELNSHLEEDMEIVDILKKLGFSMGAKFNSSLDPEFSFIYNYYFSKD